MERDETPDMPYRTGIVRREKPRKNMLRRFSPRRNYKGPRPLTILFSLLALIALLHFIAATHSAYPTPLVTDCSELIRNTDYTTFVQLQPSQTMSAVQLISEATGGQPSALVQVTHSGSQHVLDVYVYGCSLQVGKPVLTLLFKQQGLVQGTVSISKADTLCIGELDTTLDGGANILLEPQQQNIYREYIWRHGMFIQTEFPGLYPVTSREEAQSLQDQADNGQTLPWNDPLTTAQQMARELLGWPDNDPRNAVQDNNGVTAHVVLFQQSAQMRVVVTLAKLIQPNSTGLWFVTGAQTQGITLDRSQLPMPTASPLIIDGAVRLLDGQATTMLFDHTLTSMHILNNPVLGVNAQGLYTETLLYTNDVPDQPGLLLIEDTPPIGSTEAGQLLLTNVILG